MNLVGIPVSTEINAFLRQEPMTPSQQDTLKEALGVPAYEAQPYTLQVSDFQRGCYVDGVSLTALNQIAAETNNPPWGNAYMIQGITYYTLLKGNDFYLSALDGETYGLATSSVGNVDMHAPAKRIFIDKCFGIYNVNYIGSDPGAIHHLEELVIKDANFGDLYPVPAAINDFAYSGFGFYNGLTLRLIGRVEATTLGPRLVTDFNFEKPSYVKYIDFSKLEELPFTYDLYLVSNSGNYINGSLHDPGIVPAIMKLNEIGFSNGTIWVGCFPKTQFQWYPGFTEAVSGLESRGATLVFSDYVSP